MSDFGRLIKKFIKQNIRQMWTAMPVVVHKVYPEQMRVDVFTKNKKDVITNVPIHCVRGDNSIIIPPVKAGDVGLCIFCKYPISQVMVDKEINELPDAVATFSSANAIYIPGLVVEEEANTTIIGSSKYEITDDLQIISDGKIKIHGNPVEITGYNPSANLLMVYNNNSVAIPTSWGTFIFNTEYREDSAYDYNNTTGELTFDEDGTYDIHVDMSIDVSVGTSRTTSEMVFEENTGSGWVTIPGTYAFMYNRNLNHGVNTATIHIMRSFNNTDQFRVRVQRRAGSNSLISVANGCRFSIRKVE